MIFEEESEPSPSFDSESERAGRTRAAIFRATLLAFAKGQYANSA